MIISKRHQHKRRLGLTLLPWRRVRLRPPQKTTMVWQRVMPLQTMIVFLDGLRRTHLHGNVKPTLLLCTGQEASWAVHNTNTHIENNNNNNICAFWLMMSWVHAWHVLSVQMSPVWAPLQGLSVGPVLPTTLVMCNHTVKALHPPIHPIPPSLTDFIHSLTHSLTIHSITQLLTTHSFIHPSMHSCTQFSFQLTYRKRHCL